MKKVRVEQMTWRRGGERGKEKGEERGEKEKGK